MAKPKPNRSNNTTRMIDARRDMDAARKSGDRAAFNRAFSVFDRVRDNATLDEYCNTFVYDADGS
jgi:hypothetical protein